MEGPMATSLKKSLSQASSRGECPTPSLLTQILWFCDDKDLFTNSQNPISTKDFPQPYHPPPTPRMARICEIINDDDSPLILQYTRSLSGLTGIITDESMLPQVAMLASTGLGEAIDDYLKAHGYTDDAQRTIARAYKQSETQDEFVGFLCGRGMAKSEAQWLWRYVNTTN